MAVDDDPDRCPKEGGIGRKVVEDNGGSAGDGQGRQDGAERVHGVTSDNDAPTATSTAESAIDAPSEAGLDRDVSSASSERGSAARGKKRKSDEISRDGQKGQAQPAQATQHLADISQNDVDGASGATSSATQQTPHERSVSPRGRTRGMSLRSSLFSKNMQRKAPPDDAVIELQSVPTAVDGTDDSPSPKKNAGNTATVVVSPSQDRLDTLGDSLGPFTGARKAVTMLRNHRNRTREKLRRIFPIQRLSDVYATIRKFVLRIKDVPPSKDGRHIPIDSSRVHPLIDDRTNQSYIDNFIKSSKYTVWNFLPRQPFAQFSKLANFYFLTVSILQMIPGLSTTGRFTTFAPLMFFVSLSMGKEGYEDLRRHRLDKAENNRTVRVLRTHGAVPEADKKTDLEQGKASPEGHLWVPVKWQSLRVGDIIHLERDEHCPADILLLDSKGEHSIAYIETMALDGETNLKNKQPPGSLIGKCRTPDAIAGLKAEVVVEDPNVDLYNFEGKVSLVDGAGATPLTNNEIIYRGSILRNTPEAVGMVVYSGEECKIRMNANKNPRIKAPLLQTIVNKIVITMVIFVLALSFSQAIAYQFWNDFEERTWYLTDARVPFGPLITSFILMFNTLIPLSLYVALEIIKVGQILLLNDIDMYDEKSDTLFESHTSTINEELGQVSYVFSDKTGTLTENVMRFRKLSVAGTAWLHDLDLQKQSVEDDVLRRLEGSDAKGKKPLHRLSRKRTSRAPSRENVRSSSQTPRKSIASWKSAGLHVAQPELNTTEMIRYIQRRPHTAFARKASMMVLAMALCHTCIPEHGKTEDELSYQASSPDELALVEAAKDLGYIAFHREMSTLTLKTYPNGPTGEAVRSDYQILDVIEFSSQRKRMSVVVGFPDGRICVLCKGADSVIMERLRLADLARRTIAEIERKVSERRNAGAQQALERKSSIATDRRASIASHPRASIAVPRRSRSSIGRLAPVRDHVDGWLAERESEPTTPVDASHYSPRPSQQLARHSSAYASRRSSHQQDTREGDLVEEALVLNDSAVIERCFQHINDFATEGLRTLLYGHRFLDAAEYASWKRVYTDATTSLVDRQRKIDEAGELIERDLELGGATAIEDKLQDGVPETIDRLRRANIKMWMLTGDKRETAINIGHSCRLIKHYSALTILDHVAAGGVEPAITATIDEITRGTVAHSVVVVDGQTLATIHADPALHALFLDLAILADSVICCRASPSQKAGLVHAIRARKGRSSDGAVTLAIGDGANDIAMIQEAHVGIGITGKEGLQAARVSDYSVAQFRFLGKLLLVHGRWNYVRTCKYILGTFWKELLFYLTQAQYQRSTGFTGTSLYEQWSLSMFNTLFTSLPVIFLGIFEQDLRAATLLAVPELYTRGQRSAGFNFAVYFAWMALAAAESCVVYFVMFGLFGRAVFTTGQDLFSMGVLTYSACVVLINVKLQVLEQHYKTVVAGVCLFLMLGGWFLWNLIFSATYTANNELGVRDAFVQRFGRNALWWLALVLAVAACVLLELGVRATKRVFFPTDVEVFQELEKDPLVRRRFEEAAEEELIKGWTVERGLSSEYLRRKAEEEEAGVVRGDGPPPMRAVSERSERSGKGEVEVREDAVFGVRDGKVDVDEVFAKGFGRVKR